MIYKEYDVVSNLIYAIIALVALVGLSAWLIWRCLALRSALAKSQSRCHELQRDRAIRQNLQQVLDRRRFAAWIARAPEMWYNGTTIKSMMW